MTPKWCKKFIAILYFTHWIAEMGAEKERNYDWILHTWRHQMETFSALPVFCEGNPPSPMDFPHKGQWHGALMCSLICAWTNGWVNNRDVGDLRRHRVNYDVTVMRYCCPCFWWKRWWRWWRHDGMTTTAMIIRDDYAVMLITLSLASLKALKTRRYICH